MQRTRNHTASRIHEYSVPPRIASIRRARPVVNYGAVHHDDDNRRFYEAEIRNCHICGRAIHGDSGLVSDGNFFCGLHCLREHERQRRKNIMMWVSIVGGAIVLLVLLAHPEILLIPALMSIGGAVLFGKSKKGRRR